MARPHGKSRGAVDAGGMSRRHDSARQARASGTSTTCSDRNHTCSSLRRITSLTSRSLVPSSPLLGRLARHRARLLQDDFVRMQQTGDLHRRLFAPARRPRNQRHLGDVGAIAMLTPPSSWTRSAIESTSSFCSP